MRVTGKPFCVHAAVGKNVIQYSSMKVPTFVLNLNTVCMSICKYSLQVSYSAAGKYRSLTMRREISDTVRHCGM